MYQNPISKFLFKVSWNWNYVLKLDRKITYMLILIPAPFIPMLLVSWFGPYKIYFLCCRNKGVPLHDQLLTVPLYNLKSADSCMCSHLLACLLACLMALLLGNRQHHFVTTTYCLALGHIVTIYIYYSWAFQSAVKSEHISLINFYTDNKGLLVGQNNTGEMDTHYVDKLK